MNWKILLSLFVIFVSVLSQEAPVLYDAYFGKPITGKRSNYLGGVANGTSLCTIPVQACRKDEGRRVDGTCTNPKHPSRGASMAPLPRLLQPQYGPGNTLRPARDGSELPSARLLRTSLIADGSFANHEFSTLATHVLVATVADNVDLLYINRYGKASDCCVGNTPNRVNPICISIPVPGDDPYLRITQIRCLNLTRVTTYQDLGCLPNSLPAERYSVVTPLLDLSTVYGNYDARNRMIRAFQGGELSFRLEGDREVPQGNSPLCVNLQPPETSCYNYGDDFQGNLLSGIYLTVMWFFREHNRIARQLAKLNTCWDDEKLFLTARQINIAQYQYIIYYELVVEFLGRKNALAEGIIYETDGYVNDFDHRFEPGVFREYIIGLRWFHNFQPGPTDLYRDGRYIGSRPTPDDELRSGILAINNTEADLTEGSLIQPADKFDYVMAPDLAERYFGNVHLVNDLPATDIMRGRDAGLPPYNHYRKICGMKPAERWEDFYDTIDKDKVETLRRIYDDVEDVEVMVAIYIEKLLPGTYVSPTLYCIITQNLLLWRHSDKFFFEHGDFPAALTIPERYFGNVHLVNDLPATDIMRGRDAGLPPYNHYRKICGMKPAERWEDFYDTIDKDKVETLRRIYDDVEDVEVMVAIYIEKLLPGTYVSPTLYCIITQNLLLWRHSDKFFFEHGDFPAALTIPQLNEVRKTSIARVLCDSGDNVKQIQPAAFFRRGHWNYPVPCEKIPGINLNKWKDHWCPKDKKK